MDHNIVSELISAGYRVIPPCNTANNPTAVYSALKKYAKKDQEHVICVSLDNQNNIISTDLVFIGTANSCTIQAREIFIKALQRKAVNIIISHNHPSGSTDPSSEDLNVTRKIIQAGDLLGIPCLDHIIISKNGFTSLRSEYSYLWNQI